MHMKYSIVMFLSLLFVIPITLARETTTDWTIILYEEDTNSIISLQPDGVTRQVLPNVGYGAQVIKVSDDFRYAVGLFYNHYVNRYVDEVTIIDLMTEEVLYVPPPPLEDGEFFVEYEQILFSPDYSEIAVAYTSHDANSGFGCCGFGGIIIVELSTGEITHHLDVDNTFDNIGISSSWFDEWTPEGIWFAPRCWACTPPVKFFYHLWNPDNDTVVSTNRYDNIRYAERLEATGELLYGENHIDYPAGGLVFINEFVGLNVVSVYQPDESPPDTEGKVVYFDIDNLQFERPRWIMGGQAFLVGGTKDVIVFRDGTQLNLGDIVRGLYFVAMTDNGWLMTNPNTSELLHFTIEHNQVKFDVVYKQNGSISVVNALLDSSQNPLTPFENEILSPNKPLCFRNLPNRLSVGGYAKVDYLGPMFGLWVTEGSVDDISHDDWILLPIGTVVQVISEPECLSEVWVKVKYKGVTGWMVETWWGSYYLEPTARLQVFHFKTVG